MRDASFLFGVSSERVGQGEWGGGESEPVRG